MKTNHCIFYNYTDKEHYPPNETSGTCLDRHDDKGNCLPCLSVIASGRCFRNLKTPVK